MISFIIFFNNVYNVFSISIKYYTIKEPNENITTVKNW